jgi:hypothetical protein
MLQSLLVVDAALERKAGSGQGIVIARRHRHRDAGAGYAATNRSRNVLTTQLTDRGASAMVARPSIAETREKMRSGESS